jgi:hypothetical protein
MWLVVEIGHLMCFNRWIHCFIGLKDDIYCDLFFEWIQWMILFQMGTLCDFIFELDSFNGSKVYG